MEDRWIGRLEDGQIDFTQLTFSALDLAGLPFASANSLLSVQPWTLDLPAFRSLGLEGAVFCPSAHAKVT
jgi:hypothetical protein